MAYSAVEAPSSSYRTRSRLRLSRTRVMDMGVLLGRGRPQPPRVTARAADGRGGRSRPGRGGTCHLGSGERSEEHTSELQSRGHLVCRLLLEKKKNLN